MPISPDIAAVIEAAEHEVSTGNLAAAESLLLGVAEAQEASLGPLHPDLASTFNNLAVVCEMANRPDDAERFYRRAHAIVSASLDRDHPLVVTSRDNLRHFLLARRASPEWPEEPAAPVGVAEPGPAVPAAVVAPVHAVPEAAPAAPSRPTWSSRMGVRGTLAAVATLVALVAVWSSWPATETGPPGEATPAVALDGALAPPSAAATTGSVGAPATPSRESSPPPASPAIPPALDPPSRAVGARHEGKHR